MKKLFFLLLLVGFSTRIFSAEPPATPAVEPNRFLFVIENSSAMRRSAKAAQQVVRELIESGVQGEMRPGDTFGIWTFDEQLNMTFPLQHWSPNESRILSLRAYDFLKKHRYENKGPLKIALPKIYSLMKASKSIIVILVSTGSEAIVGTPFDAQINSIYPQYARDLHDAKLPFVTVLIGFNGRPVAYSVNSSLGPIQIPHPPKKREVVSNEKTNAVAVAAKTATNQVAVPPAPAIPNIEIKPEIKTEVAPEISAEVSNPIIAPQVAFAAPTEKVDDAGSPTPGKTEPLKISETSAATTLQVSTSSTPQVEPLKEKEPANSPEGSSKVGYEDPSSFKPQLQKDLPQPTYRSKPDTLRKHNTAPLESTSTQESSSVKSISPTPVVASQPTLTPKKLLMMGAALLVVAGILVFLLVRHSRKTQPSFISRSIDRNK